MLKDLRRAWDSHVQNILSSAQEDEVDRIFAPIGQVNKITPTNKNSTSDRRIDSAKLLIEITTINADETSGNVRQDDTYLIRKVNIALNHLKKSNASQFPNYYRGGIIYLDTLIFGLTDLLSKLKDQNFIKNFSNSIIDLDYVVFIPRPISINYSDSREKYPTIVWFKDTSLEQILHKLDVLNKEFIKI